MQTQNDAKTNDAFLCIFMRNTSSQFMFITQQNHFMFMINIHVMVNC